MSVRRLLRGEVSTEALDRIAAEVARRYDAEAESVTLLEADNWLSTPCVVNEEWFVKVITAQNSLVHALLTTGRNLGAFSSGSEGIFDHFGPPVGMAEHELEATRQMRQLGVNAPEPLEAFEFEGYGILVLEYLPAFETLTELRDSELADATDALFESLATMHDAGLVHGDLRAENVLVVDGALHFIDATKVREGAVEDAKAYDIACALAAIEPLVGARDAVAAARDHYAPADLLAADSFLDFVNIRPDHDFDAVAVKGEISKIEE